MENLHDLAALRIVKTVEEVEEELAIHLGYKANPRKSTYDPGAIFGTKSASNVIESVPSPDDGFDEFAAAASVAAHTHDESADAPAPATDISMDQDEFFKKLQEGF